MVVGQDAPSVKPHLVCPKAPLSTQKQGSSLSLPLQSTCPTGPGISPQVTAGQACPCSKPVHGSPVPPSSWAGHLRPFLMCPTCFPVQLQNLPLPFATPLFGELFFHKFPSFFLPFRYPSNLPPPPGSLPRASGGADRFLSGVYTELASLVSGAVYLDGVGRLENRHQPDSLLSSMPSPGPVQVLSISFMKE